MLSYSLLSRGPGTQVLLGVFSHQPYSQYALHFVEGTGNRAPPPSHSTNPFRSSDSTRRKSHSSPTLPVPALCAQVRMEGAFAAAAGGGARAVPASRRRLSCGAWLACPRQPSHAPRPDAARGRAAAAAAMGPHPRHSPAARARQRLQGPPLGAASPAPPAAAAAQASVEEEGHDEGCILPFCTVDNASNPQYTIMEVEVPEIPGG